MNTRLENTRLDHRPGWAFYSAVFCISYEAKSISGAAENAGKVPGTRALGIKLASVQRHGVVSYHLFCIFIIHQCEEVFVTKKKKNETKFLGKYHLIRSPSPQPWRFPCVISIWLCAIPLAVTSLSRQGWCGLQVAYISQKPRLLPQRVGQYLRI